MTPSDSSVFDLNDLPPQVRLQMPLRRVHARREHGGGEVLVYEAGYQYQGQWYTSCRKLMAELYGLATSGMTFDRYFRLGRWATGSAPEGSTILEALGSDLIQVDVSGLGKGQSARRVCPGAAGRWARDQQETTILEALGVSLVQPTKPAPVPVQPWVEVEPTVQLGIDLGKRAHEVRKLLFAGFGPRMARSGYDPEDVLQEVYKGLLTRNAGRGKFDPRRSSFGHYIHLVCGSILANYHRKMSRRREMEQVGMRGLNCDSGNLEYLDASQASDSMAGHDMLHGGSVVGTEDTAAWSLALEALERHLRASNVGELAIQAMLYAAQGFTRSEIARILDQDPGRVGRALAKLRRATRSWEPELILEGSWGGA